MADIPVVLVVGTSAEELADLILDGIKRNNGVFPKSDAFLERA